MRCLFVSDLHGRRERYARLYGAVKSEVPDVVFLGGDLLPGVASGPGGVSGTEQNGLHAGFAELRRDMQHRYPRIFMILGNDDPREYESEIVEGAAEGLWTYVHNAKAELGIYSIFGYSCVPPTPFLLKDWERYDVSRYIPPGGVSPEEGFRTVARGASAIRFRTIEKDLRQLTGRDDLEQAICLFHSPPYGTELDRAGLDGRMVDHVPLDVHVGSIAIRRFIEERQPLLTLHGHIHESTRITGSWRDRLGRTHMFNAAHDGPELALIRFDLEDLDSAERELI